MFSRTPGRIRKLLRNVSGMDASFGESRTGPLNPGYPVTARRWRTAADGCGVSGVRRSARCRSAALWRTPPENGDGGCGRT